MITSYGDMDAYPLPGEGQRIIADVWSGSVHIGSYHGDDIVPEREPGPIIIRRYEMPDGDIAFEARSFFYNERIVVSRIEIASTDASVLERSIRERIADRLSLALDKRSLMDPDVYHVETEIEAAHREALAEEAQREERRRAEAVERAYIKAKRLFVSLLTDEQRYEFYRDNRVTVRWKCGRTFVIDCTERIGTSNITMTASWHRKYSLCVGPSEFVPRFDRYAAQLIYLQSDKAGELVKKANKQLLRTE